MCVLRKILRELIKLYVNIDWVLITFFLASVSPWKSFFWIFFLVWSKNVWKNKNEWMKVGCKNGVKKQQSYLVENIRFFHFYSFMLHIIGMINKRKYKKIWCQNSMDLRHENNNFSNTSKLSDCKLIHTHASNVFETFLFIFPFIFILFKNIKMEFIFWIQLIVVKTCVIEMMIGLITSSVAISKRTAARGRSRRERGSGIKIGIVLRENVRFSMILTSRSWLIIVSNCTQVNVQLQVVITC